MLSLLKHVPPSLVEVNPSSESKAVIDWEGKGYHKAKVRQPIEARIHRL